MKNNQIVNMSKLIPLLIKYIEVNKVVFPMEKLNIYLMKKL